jgi:anaerobic selenocysteine-containing dehydrogenase
MSTADNASATTIVRTTCPRDCYDACGIVVTFRDGEISQVRGDPQHPVSRGKLCAKCSIGYNGVWRDPGARLLRPMRRAGPKGAGRFEPVSWNEALTDIAARLKAIVAECGAPTILNTHYTGTFSLIGFHFPMRFFNRLGATEVSPDTICNNAGHAALGYVYGTSLQGFDPRSAKDAACIMVWGANPSASAPHAHAQWLQEAPAKVVVVDPIRTPTAQAADLHLQPFPGSDAALAFGILHVIRRDGLIDRPFLAAHAIGWEELEPRLDGCTPAWAEAVTGVPREHIEQAAHLYAGGPSLLWLGQGFQRQPRGGNAMRACSMLPAVTGNLGKPGAGFLYLNGVGTRGVDDGYLMGTHLAGNGAPPAVSHMDVIDWLEDSDRSRALFCWNVNNVASNPQQTRLRRALKREDLFTVVVDVFPTDTTDYADYVLPAASFLEADDLFTSYFDQSISAVVKATEPMGESLPNSEIFRRLARAMDYVEPELYESDAAILAQALSGTGLDEDFASLAAKGTVPISPEPVIQFEGLRFPTPSGRIEIASASAEAAGYSRLPEPHADTRPDGGRLRLLSPASSWALNDIFSNDPQVEAQLGPGMVYMHPDDARERGLADGAAVLLSNDVGELQLNVSVSDIVPRGVALSHKGRWPKRQPGAANVNVLNPGLKADMGESSSVHAVEVTVRAAST